MEGNGMSDNLAAVLKTVAEASVYCVLFLCVTYCTVNSNNHRQERWLIENQTEAQQ